MSARLRSITRAKSADFQLILRRCAIERLLFRLSNSPYRDRFILKGAILFTAWLDDPFRPTHDLDLLGRGDSSTASTTAIFREICRTAVEDDGLVFGINELDAKPIRRDQQHGGVRVKTTAFIAKTRIPVQVDIGFGDAVVPAAQDLEIPPLLASRGPWIAAYPKEAVVAEKLQAIVKLGRVNSRIKDLYDLLAISRHFDFDGQTLPWQFEQPLKGA